MRMAVLNAVNVVAFDSLLASTAVNGYIDVPPSGTIPFIGDWDEGESDF